MGLFGFLKKEKKSANLVNKKDQGKNKPGYITKNKVELTKENINEIFHSYVALDTETTGTNYDFDVIIEIGAVRFIDGKPVELSLREYELLKYLVDNANIALSRDKILNNVWNYDYYGDSRTIDSHIKKIRSKLGKKGKHIKTMRGIGYKFEIK